MRNTLPWIFVILMLPGCSALSVHETHWAGYMSRVDQMGPKELQATRAALLDDYREQPNDRLRLRLCYVQSRSRPSLPELQQARSILAEVSASGPYAGIRHLLDRQLALQMQLQETEGKVLQLKAQLEKLKEIETDLSRPKTGAEDDKP